ncbi:MAG: hypothetical protein H6819_06835 [Phycisphaerales bacterium]|nr:hypothetical protein [Phycisphaerales bacterium]MCB9855296.1 hypothetical protein [Phycisphaerales bacterium]MCB9862889.1 hypothetical protein [Phycisphaerales bacterium]
MRFHYRTITSYRERPPKWTLVEEKTDYRSPTQRYIDSVDQSVRDSRSFASLGSANDVASFVFTNQVAANETTSRQLAYVIEERRALQQRHLKDIQFRIDELMERKPLRRPGLGFYDDATLTEVERQILKLELEKRDVELALWRDTHELRSSLVNERRDREATRRRLGYFVAGDYGGV